MEQCLRGNKSTWMVVALISESRHFWDRTERRKEKQYKQNWRWRRLELGIPTRSQRKEEWGDLQRGSGWEWLSRPKWVESMEQRRAQRGFVSPLNKMPSIEDAHLVLSQAGNIWVLTSEKPSSLEEGQKETNLVNWFSQIHQNEAIRLSKLISLSVTGARQGSESTDRNAHCLHPQEADNLEKTSEPRHRLRSSKLCHGILCTVGKSYKHNRAHRSTIH